MVLSTDHPRGISLVNPIYTTCAYCPIIVLSPACYWCLSLLLLLFFFMCAHCLSVSLLVPPCVVYCGCLLLALEVVSPRLLSFFSGFHDSLLLEGWALLVPCITVVIFSECYLFYLLLSLIFFIICYLLPFLPVKLLFVLPIVSGDQFRGYYFLYHLFLFSFLTLFLPQFR